VSGEIFLRGIFRKSSRNLGGCRSVPDNFFKKNFYNFIKNFIKNFYNFIKNFIKNFYNFIKNFIKNFYNFIKNFIKSFYNFIKNFIKNFYNFTKNFIKNFYDFIKNFIKNFYNFIKNFCNFLKQLWCYTHLHVKSGGYPFSLLLYHATRLQSRHYKCLHQKFVLGF
jgi:preprotein translocase subunit Sss1